MHLNQLHKRKKKPSIILLWQKKFPTVDGVEAFHDPRWKKKKEKNSSCV